MVKSAIDEIFTLARDDQNNILQEQPNEAEAYQVMEKVFSLLF